MASPDACKLFPVFLFHNREIARNMPTRQAFLPLMTVWKCSSVAAVLKQCIRQIIYQLPGRSQSILRQLIHWDMHDSLQPSIVTPFHYSVAVELLIIEKMEKARQLLHEIASGSEYKQRYPNRKLRYKVGTICGKLCDLKVMLQELFHINKVSASTCCVHYPVRALMQCLTVSPTQLNLSERLQHALSHAFFEPQIVYE